MSKFKVGLIAPSLKKDLKESIWSGYVFPFDIAPTPAVGTVLTDPEAEGVEGIPKVIYPYSLLELTNAVRSIMYYVGGTNTEGTLGIQPYRLNFNSGYSNIDSFPPLIGETPEDRETVRGSSYFDIGWKSLASRIEYLGGRDIVTSDTVVSNTTTETTIFTSTISSNFISTPTMIDFDLSGIYSTGNASDVFTARVKFNGIAAHTFESVPKNVTNTPVEIIGKFTVRTVGVSGTIDSKVTFAAHNESLFGSSVGSSSIDTTSGIVITVTMEWDNASVSNTGTVKQGSVKITTS